MGYEAEGHGGLTLKDGVSELPQMVLDLLENYFDVYCWKRYVSLDFAGRYDESDLPILAKVSPYISDGNSEFIGDDDAFWAIRFDPERQKWYEKNGTRYYGADDLFSDEEQAFLMRLLRSENSSTARKVWDKLFPETNRENTETKTENNEETV